MAEAAVPEGDLVVVRRRSRSSGKRCRESIELGGIPRLFAEFAFENKVTGLIANGASAVFEVS